MKPSSRNTSKTPRLRRLLRQVTFLRRIDTALRMRVNISAVRSCNDMVWSLNIVLSNKYRRSELPRSFSHAWDHSQQRQLAQHMTTDSKLSIIRAGMSRDLATISFSRRELRRNFHFCKYAFTCHRSPFRQLQTALIGLKTISTMFLLTSRMAFQVQPKQVGFSLDRYAQRRC